MLQEGDGVGLEMVVGCVVLLVRDEDSRVAGTFGAWAVLEEEGGVFYALGNFADALEYSRYGFCY